MFLPFKPGRGDICTTIYGGVALVIFVGDVFLSEQYTIVEWIVLPSLGRHRMVPIRRLLWLTHAEGLDG